MIAAKRTPGKVVSVAEMMRSYEPHVARIAELERMLADQTRDALLVMTDDAARIAELEAALRAVTNMHAMPFDAGTCECVYRDQTGAMAAARAALAKVSP